MDVLTHLRTWPRCYCAAALSALILTSAPPRTALAATAWTVLLSGARTGQARSTTPAAPATVTASCTGLTTPIVVSWSAVSHASGYTVYQSTGGGSYTAATTITAPTTTWSYSPPGLLQTYAFKVTATVGTNWVSAMSAASATRTVTALLVCT